MKMFSVYVMETRVSRAYRVFSTTFSYFPWPSANSYYFKTIQRQKPYLQKDIEKGLNIANYIPLPLIYYNITRNPR